MEVSIERLIFILKGNIPSVSITGPMQPFKYRLARIDKICIEFKGADEVPRRRRQKRVNLFPKR